MNKLSILEYNIWFDRFEQEKRLISLLETIDHYSPDVICLQEVIPEISNLLIANLKKYKYVFPDKIDLAYGCQIFSVRPFIHCKEYEYEKTFMGRKLYCVVIECNSQEYSSNLQNIVIATSHFESEFKKSNPIKTSQYDQAHTILNKYFSSYGPVIMCADTNILPNEEKYFLTEGDESWLDAWSENGADHDKMYTYDTKLNVNLQNRNFHKEIRSRIDRVIYRGRSVLRPLDFKLIKRFEDKIEPSDHFGILADFEVRNDKVEI